MTRIELNLTIPDDWWMSANHRSHWTKRKTASANLRVYTLAECQRARLPKGLSRVRLVAWITYPTAAHVDPNNAAPTTKAITDGLVDYGLVADDDHAHVLGPDHRYAGVTKGRRTVRIVVEEVG